MNKTFTDRLETLERLEGDAYFILLYGDDCDTFDRMRAAGDAAALFDLLASTNPNVPLDVLRSFAAGKESPRVTGILARYGDAAWGAL